MGKEAQDVFGLINDHYHATESQRAMTLLKNWDQEVLNFVKVMPRDYKKALERLAQETKQEQIA